MHEVAHDHGGEAFVRAGTRSGTTARRWNKSSRKRPASISARRSRDVVEITLAEERHVVTFNNTYWTGWMNAANAYAAPYSLWAPFIQSFLKIQPGPGQ